MKEEALKLADELQDYMTSLGWQTHQAPEMICRLVDRMVELESCLDFAVQDTMDYINLNNLGGENNHWLVWARKLLVNTTPQTKPLSDEEKQLVREIVGSYVCTIKMEIDQEKQTFKGYEHCSNIPSLQSELKDAEKAMDILRKAWD